MSELFSANNLRGLAAEFIATFTFVFVGVGAIGAAFSLGTPIDGAGIHWKSGRYPNPIRAVIRPN